MSKPKNTETQTPAFDQEAIDKQIAVVKGDGLEDIFEDPNEALTASNEPKAEEPSSTLPVEATKPLMPIEGKQHVQEPEQAINVLDVAIEAFREAEEQSQNHGYTSEQTFLHLFLPALTAKGLQITAIPAGQ